MSIAKVVFRSRITGLIFSPLSTSSWAAVILTDRPDVKIRDATTNVEAWGHECTVAVHPDDWRIVLMSVISSRSGSDRQCLEWISTDGGNTWKGDSLNDHSADLGDPAVAILKGSPTRYFVQGISKDFGQRVVFADSPTAAFDTLAVVAAESDTDKGFLAVDNTTSSRSGTMYSLWYRVGAGLALRYSPEADRGAAWAPASPILLRSTGVSWGGVIAIGIADSVLGHVYVAWPQGTGVPQNEPVSINFKRSVDETLPPDFEPVSGVQVMNYSTQSFGARSDLPSSNNNGANSIPSMAADDQGNIYIAWCQRRKDGTDAHVYMKKSTDNGDSWSDTLAVANSTKNQWLPWIAWDNEAKALVAMYHDSRSHQDTAEVYVAVSYDRGSTFNELKVSDVPWSGNPTGVIGNDYNGIASGGGVAYPTWCDDRDGTLKTYTCPILIGGIEGTSIVPTISHFCTSSGSPRIHFQVNWSTLAFMDGLDKLTVTRPGGPPVSVTASSTSKTHQLVIENLSCGNGTWTYQVESKKGSLSSQSAVISVSVSCITCPPCSGGCELD